MISRSASVVILATGLVATACGGAQAEERQLATLIQEHCSEGNDTRRGLCSLAVTSAFCEQSDHSVCVRRRRGAEANPDDFDGDQIPNHADACPRLAEDRDMFEDDDGCPDTDNDNDLVLDVDDRCPDEAPGFDEDEDEDGCPDP